MKDARKARFYEVNHSVALPLDEHMLATLVNAHINSGMKD